VNIQQGEIMGTRVKSWQASEDQVTGAFDRQTSMVPSSLFLRLALGSMVVSAVLKLSGKNHWALFVGQWAAPFLIMGNYNKSVKQYALGVQQPIHIIVRNGKVTLEGVVDNEGDKNIANIQANGVPGVFSVTTLREARGCLELLGKLRGELQQPGSLHLHKHEHVHTSETATSEAEIELMISQHVAAATNDFDSAEIARLETCGN
jgi:hypothetical protein